MKFLGLDHFQPASMDALSWQAIDVVMEGCRPPLEAIYRSGRVIADIGVATASRCRRRVNGNASETEGPFASPGVRTGSAFLAEAQDMGDAIRVARRHPTLPVDAGESWDGASGAVPAIASMPVIAGADPCSPPAPAAVGLPS